MNIRASIILIQRAIEDGWKFEMGSGTTVATNKSNGDTRIFQTEHEIKQWLIGTYS